jgi:CheY-like chemotaxis protein
MTRRSVRVLVVEDDPNVRRDVSEVLDEEGYEVEQASHGVEALERARARRPDVVLLDLYLPLMDGWALRNALRTLDADRAPVIIVMTTDRYAHEEAKQLGAHGCLPKPFDLDDLLRLLAQVSIGAT